MRLLICGTDASEIMKKEFEKNFKKIDFEEIYSNPSKLEIYNDLNISLRHIFLKKIWPILFILHKIFNYR